MRDIALYVRVSTPGQNDEGQRQELAAWATRQGWVDCTWYVDKASGDDLDRPGMDRLQADIFSGLVSTVVVWKLDRISRTIRDGVALLSAWCDRGLRVVSVTQQIDLSGTVGRMIAAVLLGVAEIENDYRRERQAVGIQAAKARGVYKGRKPGSTIARPDRARQLKKKGFNQSEIAQAMGISRRTVARYTAE